MFFLLISQNLIKCLSKKKRNWYHQPIGWASRSFQDEVLWLPPTPNISCCERHIQWIAKVVNPFAQSAGGCRIHRPLLYREERPPQWVSWNDPKQSDSEVQVMLDWFLLMDQIELNCVLMLNWIVWNRTVFK